MQSFSWRVLGRTIKPWLAHTILHIFGDRTCLMFQVSWHPQLPPIQPKTKLTSSHPRGPESNRGDPMQAEQASTNEARLLLLGEPWRSLSSLSSTPCSERPKDFWGASQGGPAGDWGTREWTPPPPVPNQPASCKASATYWLGTGGGGVHSLVPQSFWVRLCLRTSILYAARHHGAESPLMWPKVIQLIKRQSRATIHTSQYSRVSFSTNRGFKKCFEAPSPQALSPSPLISHQVVEIGGGVRGGVGTVKIQS